MVQPVKHVVEPRVTVSAVSLRTGMLAVLALASGATLMCRSTTPRTARKIPVHPAAATSVTTRPQTAATSATGPLD